MRRDTEDLVATVTGGRVILGERTIDTRTPVERWTVCEAFERCAGVREDETLDLAEALGKYKYQPFVEKRHEQLKSVFGVAPMWLKNVGRVASLLWLYYVVELAGALVEREVRRQMAAAA